MFVNYPLYLRVGFPEYFHTYYYPVIGIKNKYYPVIGIKNTYYPVMGIKNKYIKMFRNEKLEEKQQKHENK